VNRPRSTPSHSRLGSLFPAAVLIAAVFILVGAAQLPRPHISSVQDWTHHHLIYSQPSTWVSAWRAQQDPRYWQQKIRRGEMNQPHAAFGAREATATRESLESRETFDSREITESRREDRSDDNGPVSDWARNPFRLHGPTPPGWHHHLREIPMERDWGTSLGNGGSTGVPVAGTTWFPIYPAKFSFNVSAAPDCTNDFVVFPTNLTGASAGQASIVAYNKLYSNTAGTGFCTAATGPAVYWSYNTNLNATGGKTTGTIATSPILSADGTKVAFIENNGGAGAVLHLLKWKAGDGGAIGTALNPTTTTAWTSCPATGACMISMTLANASADTGSSPFYDYTHDALYAGDDAGNLHKFVNVFGITGTSPSEVTTGGWPSAVDATFALNSPILDAASGNIFVDDLNGTLSYIRETFSTVGTCKTGSPPCIGSTTVVPSQIHSLIDAPIVDSSTQKVFVFYANYDGTNMAVVQSDTALSANVPTLTGSKLNQRHMHVGAFDNAYLTGTGSAGRLYVCGASATGLPTLMRVGFNNTATAFPNATGTMNTTVDATPTLQVVSTVGAVDCGPLTEFFNANAAAASQDQLFFGVAGDSTSAICIAAGVGCVMSVNITNTPVALIIGSSIPEIMGASGIIVDNNSTSAQASSLYFSNQGNSTNALKCGPTTGGTVGVGCAVKVTQSGLN
jgi:hypothetical protein